MKVGGKTTRNNPEKLKLAWTSWNLDKHHIVKDRADVVVSWPWNKVVVDYCQTDSKCSLLAGSTMLLSYYLEHESVHFFSDVFICK